MLKYIIVAAIIFIGGPFLLRSFSGSEFPPIKEDVKLGVAKWVAYVIVFVLVCFERVSSRWYEDDKSIVR